MSKWFDQLFYEDKRRSIRKRFKAMKRGAQSRCAFDLRIAHTTVSRILSGNYKSEATLRRLEKWLDAQEEIRP